MRFFHITEFILTSLFFQCVINTVTKTSMETHLKLKKIYKIALLATFSYLSITSSFAATSYDIAGIFESIPHDQRLGRADNWLTRSGHNTDGVKALANATPEMIIALAKRDSTAVKAIVNRLKTVLTDADRSYAIDELTRLSTLTTPHNADLTAKINAYHTAIRTGSSGTAPALDILATMGLFGKMENGLAVWNNTVHGQSIPNVTAYLNNISLALVYMVNGNADAAQALAEGQTAFTGTETVFWNTLIGYALNGTPDNGYISLVNQIDQAALKTLAVRFIGDFKSAINKTTSIDPTAPTAPFPEVDKAELADKYTGIDGLTRADVMQTLNTFSRDMITADTLKNRTLADTETKVLNEMAKNDPDIVAGILSSYFEKKDVLTNVTDGNYIPEALVKIAQENSSVVSALIIKGGLIDLTQKTPSGTAIPLQVIAVISGMTTSNSAKAMQDVIDQLPAGAQLPLELKKAQGSSFGF